MGRPWLHVAPFVDARYGPGRMGDVAVFEYRERKQREREKRAEEKRAARIAEALRAGVS
jgi:hypothetical protein